MKFFRRLNIAVLLSLLSIGAGNLGLVSAQTVSKVDEVRAKAKEIGTGPDAKVELTLASGTSVKGHIEGIAIDSFTVVDSKTGSSQTIDFANVAKIKKQRNGLKPRTWIIIGAAAVAAIIVAKTVIYPVLCDGGAGC